MILMNRKLPALSYAYSHTKWCKILCQSDSCLLSLLMRISAMRDGTIELTPDSLMGLAIDKCDIMKWSGPLDGKTPHKWRKLLRTQTKKCHGGRMATPTPMATMMVMTTMIIMMKTKQWICEWKGTESSQENHPIASTTQKMWKWVKETHFGCIPVTARRTQLWQESRTQWNGWQRFWQRSSLKLPNSRSKHPSKPSRMANCTSDEAWVGQRCQQPRPCRPMDWVPPEKEAIVQQHGQWQWFKHCFKKTTNVNEPTWCGKGWQTGSSMDDTLSEPGSHSPWHLGWHHSQSSNHTEEGQQCQHQFAMFIFCSWRSRGNTFYLFFITSDNLKMKSLLVLIRNMTVHSLDWNEQLWWEWTLAFQSAILCAMEVLMDCGCLTSFVLESVRKKTIIWGPAPAATHQTLNSHGKTCNST